MNIALHSDLQKYTASEKQQQADAERRARELREDNTSLRPVRRKWRI